MTTDLTPALQERVAEAAASGTPLNIVGGGSKAFLGRRAHGTPLAVAGHRGILSYEPKELVLTARAGTPLTEIEAVLAEQGQMLAFEPPHFGATATLGGSIAAGVSGPRRPYAGAARDQVLGVRMINGRAEVLRFGGEVMKNVAGYDLSRLMTGAFGTLGVLLDISLKVVPRPALEITLAQECDAARALALFTDLSRRALPISAACHDGNRLYLRIEGAESAVQQALVQIGGESLTGHDHFWRDEVKEHGHPCFAGDTPLWRVSLPPATPLLDLPGKVFLDWGGAQRWLKSDAPASALHALALQAGGHASLFRGGNPEGEIFQPLAPNLYALHQRLKTAFDPHGIFNHGRMYAGL
ncbi:MAG: glycolate oxidase subunit GlcE [Betaproteobacteria bacterium]|nr:MAG: glycolate oxidase subunit GlcE [Betaproteobacteria bacterium]